MRRTVVLVVLGLAVFGCSGGFRRATARRPDSRAMIRLERQAQREMHCPTSLHVVMLESRAFQVDGCGQMREYAWVCPGRRCSFQPIVPAVIQASGDLRCPPAQLATSADAPTHRAFFGCSRGAAYSLMCVDHGCVWSRTPEAVTIATPAAPVAPVDAVGDATLEGAIIPPPPGAPSAFEGTESPPPSTVPPPPPAPPPSAPPPTTTAPASSDTVVIPPPPS